MRFDIANLRRKKNKKAAGQHVMQRSCVNEAEGTESNGGAGRVCYDTKQGALWKNRLKVETRDEEAHKRRINNIQQLE